MENIFWLMFIVPGVVAMLLTIYYMSKLNAIQLEMWEANEHLLQMDNENQKTFNILDYIEKLKKERANKVTFINGFKILGSMDQFKVNKRFQVNPHYRALATRFKAQKNKYSWKLAFTYIGIAVYWGLMTILDHYFLHYSQ